MRLSGQGMGNGYNFGGENALWATRGSNFMHGHIDATYFTVMLVFAE